MVQLLQANLNLNQDERLLEAVRRHRDLWHMRSWQPERRTVLEMMSTCCGSCSSLGSSTVVLPAKICAGWF